jgi:hypothetical protein
VIDALVAQARAVAGKQIELADARLAAQSKKLEVANGLDPNSEKREALRIATQLVASRRTLKDVLDQYEHITLAQLRRGANVRRAIDGKRGLLRAFVNQDVASITRRDVLYVDRTHYIMVEKQLSNKSARSKLADPRRSTYCDTAVGFAIRDAMFDQNRRPAA